MPAAANAVIGSMTTAWTKLREIYGQKLAMDVLAVLPGLPKDAKTAVSQVMLFLAEAEDSNMRRLFQSYKQGKSVSGFDACDATAELVERWLNDAGVAKRYARTTIKSYAVCFAGAACRLGGLKQRSYPPCERPMFRIPEAVGQVPTLGSLGWPELTKFPAAQADKEALALVRSAAVREFERMEAICDFGWVVLCNPNGPDAVNPVAWSDVRAYLQVARERLRTRDIAGKDLLRDDLTRRALRDEPTRRGRVDFMSRLVATGMPSWTVAEFGAARSNLNRRDQLTTALLGPTKWMTLALVAVVACDTGWNRHTILAMHRSPFAVRTVNGYALAASMSLESVKTKTNKLVRSALDDETLVSRLEAENAMAAWLEVAEGNEALVDGECHLDEGIGATLLDLLRRYRRCADRVRQELGIGESEGDFFASVRADGHLTNGRDHNEDLSLSILFRHCCLGRPCVDFLTIRETFLSVRYPQVGSATGVSVLAGHARSRVTLKTYLTSEAVTREFDSSVRYFQNMVEAILHRGREPGATDEMLGLPPGASEWFGRLGRVSGLAAAFGLAPTIPSTLAPRLDFDASPARLAELYLLHRSLTATRQAVEPSRWRLQGSPLLTLTKAIGVVLVKGGLRRRYYQAARTARANLACGKAFLPVVLDAS